MRNGRGMRWRGWFNLVRVCLTLTLSLNAFKVSILNVRGSSSNAPFACSSLLGLDYELVSFFSLVGYLFYMVSLLDSEEKSLRIVG